MERIRDDEAVLEDGKKEVDLIEEVEHLQARSDGQILVMVDDIPDADAAPPDNVLFVCRLNAMTESEDLRIIFSQHGAIKSCDVVRDWKTGDSLQYAFIEYAEVSECQRAYMKMENVLIDDRRIHVDFSQSVAKHYWHHRRRGKFERGNNHHHPRVEEANARRRGTERDNGGGTKRKREMEFESVADDADNRVHRKVEKRKDEHGQSERRKDGQRKREKERDGHHLKDRKRGKDGHKNKPDDRRRRRNDEYRREREHRGDSERRRKKRGHRRERSRSRS